MAVSGIFNQFALLKEAPGSIERCCSLNLSKLGIQYSYGKFATRLDDSLQLLARLNRDLCPVNGDDVSRVYDSPDLIVYADKACWYLVCKKLNEPTPRVGIIAYPRDESDFETLQKRSRSLLYGGPSHALPGSVGILKGVVQECEDGRVLDVEMLQSCMSKSKGEHDDKDAQSAHRREGAQLGKKYLPWADAAIKVLLEVAREKDLSVGFSLNRMGHDSNSNKLAQKLVVDSEIGSLDVQYTELAKEFIARAHRLGFISIRYGNSELRFVPRFSETHDIPEMVSKFSVDGSHPVKDTFGEPLAFATWHDIPSSRVPDNGIFGHFKHALLDFGNLSKLINSAGAPLDNKSVDKTSYNTTSLISKFEKIISKNPLELHEYKSFISKYLISENISNDSKPTANSPFL